MAPTNERTWRRKVGVVLTAAGVGLAAIGLLASPSGADHVPDSMVEKCQDALLGGREPLGITTDPAPGTPVAPGDTVDVLLTWDPAWWNEVNSIVNCAFLNGTMIHDSVGFERGAQAENDGEFTNSFSVPETAAPGDEICSVGRFSGYDSEQNPDDDTHESPIVCFPVTGGGSTTTSSTIPTSTTSSSSTSSTTLAPPGGGPGIEATTSTTSTTGLPVVLPTIAVQQPTSTTTTEAPTTTAAVAPTVVLVEETTPTTARVLGTQLPRTGAGSNTLLVLGGLVLVLGGMALTFGEPQMARRRR